MFWKERGRAARREAELRPDSKDAARSHDDSSSSIFAGTVSSDVPDVDPHATLTASPSTAEPTRTGDALPASGRPYERPSAAAQVRDPDRYLIINEHGRGGLGRVSRAHDRDLGRDVAIKELISRGNVSEVRFLREALITARLEHPGIVPVHEAGRWPDGTPFYAMKLVAGRPLRDLIAERTTVAERIGLLHHVIAVADAIAYAHGRNIIHRDLKPANVIVGDFGETIVIDWGLAKDLSTTEESTIGGGPFRANRDNDLTVAGSVLGTPAYMAPEQERGEHVDQRADVFAIGAMLWELCSLQKVPPTDARLRHRMLRRAGIDQDLITIIDKALDPDAQRRYPDASALAADLKAFKAGARIAARSYSLFAMLAHWARRHRALTVGTLVAAAIAAAGISAYVHNIESERDRVDAANNNLILQHAELLLRTDPTMAFDLLRTYHGAETPWVAMLNAKARGLGLSYVRARPHISGVLFVHRLKDDTLVTLSVDGTIAKTSKDGSKRTIARDVSAQNTFDFAYARQLLAYACDDAGICLMDLGSDRMLPLSADARTSAPIGLAFSPNENLLAAISTHGEVSVWHLSKTTPITLGRRFQLDSGESIKFVDDDTLVAMSRAGVHVFHLGTSDALPRYEQPLLVTNGRHMASNAQLQVVAVGTADGELIIISSRLNQIVQRVNVCRGSTNSVIALATQSAIGYACQDGSAGIWNIDEKITRILAHIEGGAAIAAASTDGRYMIIGGNDGQLLEFDFITQLLTSRLGHVTQITALTPPSSDYPYIISGDTTGTLRTWAPSGDDVRVVARTAGRMYKAALLRSDGSLLAIGVGGTIPWYRDGRSGELRGHHSDNFTIATSLTLPRFVMYGLDDEIEVWSLDRSPAVRVLKTAHGSVNAVVYTSEARFIVGSHDGTLEEWHEDGYTRRILGTIHEPVQFLRALPNTDDVIVGSRGTLWIMNDTGISLLGKEDDTIVSAMTSHDGNWLAVGTSRGLVRLYNIRTRKASTIWHVNGHIEHLAFSQDGARLAIASESRVSLVSIIEPATAPRSERLPRWNEIVLSVRYLAFSSDNKWFAATCDNGAIWFYDLERGRWFYISIGSAKVSLGGFSADSKSLAVSDMSGQAVIVNVPE